MVTVLDDTFRRNVSQRVTPAVRDAYFKRYRRVLPGHVVHLATRDRQGRQVQEKIGVRRSLEGPHLEHAVRRVKRWMRGSRHRAGEQAPGHILIFMAAWHELDPKAFGVAMSTGGSTI